MVVLDLASPGTRVLELLGADLLFSTIEIVSAVGSQDQYQNSIHLGSVRLSSCFKRFSWPGPWTTFIITSVVVYYCIINIHHDHQKHCPMNLPGLKGSNMKWSTRLLESSLRGWGLTRPFLRPGARGRLCYRAQTLPYTFYIVTDQTPTYPEM